MAWLVARGASEVSVIHPILRSTIASANQLEIPQLEVIGRTWISILPHQAFLDGNLFAMETEEFYKDYAAEANRLSLKREEVTSTEVL